jgi:hypothetical protein
MIGSWVDAVFFKQSTLKNPPPPALKLARVRTAIKGIIVREVHPD